MDTSFSAMNTSGETFEVEKIIAIRTDKDGRTLYKVRWLGFDEADDTWEPYENLAEDCDRLIETFYLNSEGEEGNLNENQIDDEFAEELVEGGGSHEELGEGFMDSLIQSEVDGTIVVAQGQLQQEDGISYEEDGTSEKIVSEESAKLEEFKEGPMEDDVSELQQQHNGLNDACGISVEGGLEPCGQTSSSVIIEQQQQEEQNNEVIEDDSTAEKADDANEAYETVEVLTPESWNRFGDLENREIANLFVENRIPSQTEKVLCEIGFDVGRVTRNKLRTVLKTGSASPSPNKKQIASTTKSSPPTTAATKSNAKTPRRTSNKKTRSRKKATAKEVEKLIVDESSPLEGISKGDDGILHTTDESGVVPSVSKNSDSLVGTSQDANEMANETIEEGALDEEHSDMGGSVGTERVGKTKKTVKKSGKKSRKSVKNENSARSSSSSPRGKSRGKRRQQRATCSSTPPSKRRKTLKGDSSEVSLEPESLEASDMVITSDNKSDNDSNKDANDDRSCDSDKKSENISDKMTVTAMAIAKTEDSDRDLENVKGVVNDSEDNDRTNAEGIDKNVADSGKSYENSCDGSNVGSNEQQAQEKEQTRIKAEQLEVNGGESNGRELEEATIKMEIKQEPETEQDGEKGPKGVSKGRRGTQKGRKAAQSSSAVNRRKRNPKVGRRKKLAKEEENGVVCDDAQNNSGNDSSSGNSNNSIAIGQDSSMDGCSVNSSNNNGNSSEMAAIQNESDVHSSTNNNNNSANECVVEKLSSVPSSSSDTKEQGQLSSTNEGNSGDKEGEQKSMDNRSAVSTNLQTSSTQQVAAAASASTTSAKRQSTVKGGWVSLSSCQPSTSAVSATRSVQPSIRTPQTAAPQPATQTLQTSNQIPKQSSSAQPIAPQNQSLTDQPGQSSSTSSSTPSASSEYTDYRALAIASLPLPVSLEPIQQIEAMEFRNQFRNREEPLKSFMALRNAVLNGRVNAVRWTARCPQEKRGFDFNQCFHGKTLAYEICERKCNTRTSAHINDDMLRVLVMGGARLDIPEEHNLKTPLHAAIENGSWCLVRTLLHLRSPVNTFDAKKKTPLHYAIECKDPNAIRAIYLLLEFGADVNEVLKTIRDPRLTQKLEQHQHKLAEALDEARMKTFISMTVKRKITPVMIRSMWESQWSNFTVELSFHFEKCLLPNKRYVYLIMLAVFDYFSPRYWRVRMWGRSPFESVRMNNNPPHPLQEGPNGFVFATKLVNGWNRLQIRYHPFVKNKKLLLMAQVVLAQRDKPHIFIQQPALEVAAESGTDWIKE